VRIKKSLEDGGADDDMKLNVLKHLKKKEVTYNDLSVTKIGKTVNKLSKSQNGEIAALATEVVNIWKKKCKKPEETEKSTSASTNVVKQKEPKTNGAKSEASNGKGSGTAHVQKKESAYDVIVESLKDLSEKVRNNFRKLFFDALCRYNKDTDENIDVEYLERTKNLAIDIEEQLFKALYIQGDKNNSKYVNKGKSIFSNLNSAENELRGKVLSGGISPKALVTMDVKDMASSKLKELRQKTQEEDFNSRRSDWNRIHSTVENGIYKCKQCKGMRTSKFQLQIRSADEPMTTFITCIDCNSQWKHN